MKKISINCETGERNEAEYTAEEIAEAQQLQEQEEAKRLEAEQAEAEKQAKKESAKAKLTALGLDEAEVQAILGL